MLMISVIITSYTSFRRYARTFLLWQRSTSLPSLCFFSATKLMRTSDQVGSCVCLCGWQAQGLEGYGHFRCKARCKSSARSCRKVSERSGAGPGAGCRRRFLKVPRRGAECTRGFRRTGSHGQVQVAGAGSRGSRAPEGVEIWKGSGRQCRAEVLEGSRRF